MTENTAALKEEIFQKLRNLPDNSFALCQVKTGDQYHYLRFSSLNTLHQDAMRFRERMHNETVQLYDHVFGNDAQIRERLQADGFDVLPQTVIHLIPVQDASGRMAAFCLGHGMNCCWVDGCDTRELDRLVRPESYDLVYQGSLSEEQVKNTGETLEGLFYRFNVNMDSDFTARSMSISDVVVLNQNGIVRSFYVEPIGFREIKDFLLPENHLRNAEMTIEDDYDMIDGIINNGEKKSIADELKECKSITDAHERPNHKQIKEHTALEHE